jgi:hypothetical protein
LHEKEPFGEVSMDFSKSRTVRGKRAREFRVSFLINLENEWDLSRMVVVGDEE